MLQGFCLVAVKNVGAMEKLTVLILEDDPEIRVLLSEAMLMDGHDTVLCASIEQMRKAEAEYRIGLYLIDIRSISHC